MLVCLRWGIGDLVMELPALEGLRRAFPEERLVLLGASPATQLLEGDARWDELHTVQGFGIAHRWDRGEGSTAAMLSAWLESRGFRMVLDPEHAAPALGRQVWRHELPCRQADPRAEERALQAGADGMTAIAEAAESGWGIPVPRPARADLRLEPQRSWAAASLRELTGGVTAVALLPSASTPLKRWPATRFAEVADALARETSAPLLLLEAPGDDTAARVRARMGRPEHAVRVPSLHLRRAAALLERCRLLLCNDTGLMHVAGAVGTPVVAVFGPTLPGTYLPPGEAHRGVSSDVACPHRHPQSLQPPDCWMHGDCLIAERSCVHDVDVDRVLRAVRSALSGREHRGRTFQDRNRAVSSPSHSSA